MADSRAFERVEGNAIDTPSQVQARQATTDITGQTDWTALAYRLGSLQIAGPGARAIAVERQRQITEGGYTPEHDRYHDAGQLPRAAAVYALHAAGVRQFGTYPIGSSWPWPWPDEDFKPDEDNPIRTLVKAGALIAAEIDRLSAVEAEPVAEVELTAGNLADLLSLVGVSCDPQVIERWTDEQRKQAAQWAAAEHLNASDNDVDRLPKPEFLEVPSA
jgi:hypothetical protein